jgi:hypothetical protein
LSGSTAGMTLFQLGYQISPIIFSGGIASAIPGGLLPVVAITQSASFVAGLLSGSTSGLSSLDDFFAHYKPLPGSTLIDNQIGHYPLASQQMASNAIVTQPLTISLLMICPARGSGAMITKLAVFTALKAAYDQHNISGGTYIVATPARIYPNCVMVRMADVTGGETKQVQAAYQIDFEAPLITLSQTVAAQNSLMGKLQSALPSSGSLSGIVTTIGNDISGVYGSVITSATNLVGAL